MDAHPQLVRNGAHLRRFFGWDDAPLDPFEARVLHLFQIVFGWPRDERLVQLRLEGQRHVR